MPLPQGLSLHPTSGRLIGNPVEAAAVNGAATDYTFTVQARTAAGLVARYQQTIRVYPRPTVTLVTPAGTVGVAYVGSVTGSLGSGNYAYAVQTGALPTSVSVHPTTGALSGTPTLAGTYTGTFRVTADFGGYTDKAFSITVT